MHRADLVGGCGQSDRRLGQVRISRRVGFSPYNHTSVDRSPWRRMQRARAVWPAGFDDEAGRIQLNAIVCLGKGSAVVQTWVLA